MKILALEFSSLQRSVAVFNPDTNITAEVVDTEGGQAMKPFVLIESALKQASLEREEIQAIVVGLGPGSYTGIRAAIALAQGWQLTRNVKLYGISSVACLATQEAERSPGRFNVVIDAQRSEFYLATYEVIANNLREISALRIVSAAAVQPSERPEETWIGPEVTRWFSQGRLLSPQAATLARMALKSTDFVLGEKLEPIYLRETTFVKALPPRILTG